MCNLKGKYQGNCNREACQKPDAEWYNHSTMEYYCKECATTINYWNREDAFRNYGHDLCTFGEYIHPSLLDEDGQRIHSSMLAEPLYLTHYSDIGRLYMDIEPTLRRGQKKPSKRAVMASIRTEPKIGRNEPCTCGSGLKFKKCCLIKTQ